MSSIINPIHLAKIPNIKRLDKKKDYNYHSNLLNLFYEYRKYILLSKLTLKELNKIRENFELYYIDNTGKKLVIIIQEIKILANVSLAKRGLI